jgi:predicted ABC-type ATPase
LNKLYIIAGPNGAGKTTASMEYLKYELECLEFVNADNIALGLSPFRPELVAVSAGKIMIKRIDELIKQKENFAIETTLSSKTLIDKINFAKNNKYEIILLFYYLDSPVLALKRVKERVEKGGHDISKEIIIRRYYRGMENFFTIFKKLSDYWLVINNSDIETSIIAEGNQNYLKIYDHNIWSELGEKYGQKA